ncbi:MAG: UDP-glucose 4-epimerase GalE [Gammaproteobacteria bacterium]
MKVLVTGGTGYIGSHACVELVRAGHQVTVLDNLSNSSLVVLDRFEQITGLRPEFHELDTRDLGGLDTLFEHSHFDAVMHFAGVKSVAESIADPEKYRDNNVGGSGTLMAVMAEHGVQRLLFSSSATVYGEAASSPIGETAPLGPINPYGESKLEVEKLMRVQCAADPEWCALALRYFNPVGAHASGRIGEAPQGTPNNLMPYICQVAIGRLPELAVFGSDYPTRDGTAIRDYIHVVDLARGHLAALEYSQSAKGFRVVNLGTGAGTTVLELVASFERVNGVHVPRHMAARRAGDGSAIWADPALAARLFGWRTQLGVDDMCRDAWRWQQTNPHDFGD